jgi:transcriptional regulator with XRE-family HTH domain
MSDARHDPRHLAGADGVAARFGTLGKSLVMLRVLRGLSQAEVAQRAGIRPNQISRYETGQVLPQLEQLARLLDALGIGEVDFFLFKAQVAQLEAGTATLDTAAAQAPPELVALFRELLARQIDQAERTRAVIDRLLAFGSA